MHNKKHIPYHELSDDDRNLFDDLILKSVMCNYMYTENFFYSLDNNKDSLYDIGAEFVTSFRRGVQFFGIEFSHRECDVNLTCDKLKSLCEEYKCVG